MTSRSLTLGALLCLVTLIVGSGFGAPAKRRVRHAWSPTGQYVPVVITTTSGGSQTAADGTNASPKRVDYVYTHDKIEFHIHWRDDDWDTWLPSRVRFHAVFHHKDGTETDLLDQDMEHPGQNDPKKHIGHIRFHTKTDTGEYVDISGVVADEEDKSDSSMMRIYVLERGH